MNESVKYNQAIARIKFSGKIFTSLMFFELFTYFHNTPPSIFFYTEGDEDLPEPQSLKSENKIFYFDIGQNRRGRFMRVSEVSAC